MNVILPDDKPAHDVLIAVRAALLKMSGTNYASCAVSLNNNNELEWTTYVDGSEHCLGATLQQSFAKQADKLFGKAKIDELRTNAAKLLAEADALAEKFAESRTFDRSPTINFHD